MNLAQNLGSAFGKMFRIDPLGKNSRNGKYGVPAANPFVSTADALPEIFAYGIRNMQRFGWDPKNGAMYMSDIGQNIVEEVSPMSAGANLGWNIWEGSYRFISRQAVSTESPRSDPKMTYPIVEWDQLDPVLLPNNSSVFRWRDGLSIHHGAAAHEPAAVRGHAGRRVVSRQRGRSPERRPGCDPPRALRDRAGAAPRTFLEIIQEKNRAQGKTPRRARTCGSTRTRQDRSSC